MTQPESVAGRTRLQRPFGWSSWWLKHLFLDLETLPTRIPRPILHLYLHRSSLFAYRVKTFFKEKRRLNRLGLDAHDRLDLSLTVVYPSDIFSLHPLIERRWIRFQSRILGYEQGKYGPSDFFLLVASFHNIRDLLFFVGNVIRSSSFRSLMLWNASAIHTYIVETNKFLSVSFFEAPFCDG